MFTFPSGVVGTLRITAAAFLLAFSNLSVHAAPVRFVPERFTELADKVGPAVVNISAELPAAENEAEESIPPDREAPFQRFFDHFFGREPKPRYRDQSLGSGFIIDGAGHIVTNYHVVAGADRILVRLRDKREFEADLVGGDQKTDLALIKIADETPFPRVRMGDSQELQVGEWVLAIGSPFGLEQTVTAGIVSAKERVIGGGPYDDYIQTDASINPGNSGGPLVNMEGEVVGINTAVISGGHGIGFAVPTKLARRIIDQLKETGEVTRGWLGVAIQDLTPALAAKYGLNSTEGALVAEAFENDPAAAAGIQVHDVIVGVNDTTITSSRDLIRVIADIEVGRTARIQAIRGGTKKSFIVKIAKRPQDLQPGTPIKPFP
jgi:serine protease Do